MANNNQALVDATIERGTRRVLGVLLVTIDGTPRDSHRSTMAKWCKLAARRTGAPIAEIAADVDDLLFFLTDTNWRMARWFGV